MLEVIRFVMKIFMSLFYRVKYYGVENIPEEGGYLLCCNHISDLDVIVIGLKIKRKVHWMAKEELFKVPVLAQLIKKLGAYPVARGKGDDRAKQKTMDLLKEEKIVGIFPQGTRTKGKNKDEIKAKYGAAKFAIESGKPVFPVGISGGEKLFSRINLVYGKPYVIEGEEGKEYTKDDYQRISQKIVDDIYKMLEDTVNGNSSC